MSELFDERTKAHVHAAFKESCARLDALDAEDLAEMTPEEKAVWVDGAEACPFCGATPEIQPWHGGAPTKVHIGCSSEDCDVRPGVTGETPDEALFKWNTRA